jgi:hypothetical protein
MIGRFSNNRYLFSLSFFLTGFIALEFGAPTVAQALSPVTVATSAQRAEAEQMLSSSFANVLHQAQDQLKQLPPSAETDGSQTLSCQKTYAKIYQNRTVDIRLAFGYFDVSEEGGYPFGPYNLGNNVSTDSYAAEGMRRVLTERCQGELQACGFRDEGKGVLTKVITTPDRQAHEIVLHLSHASVGLSYQENTTIYTGEQKDQTAIGEQNFFGGLDEAQVVLYLGHARNGGGPDFNPPHLAANGHPNYNGYYLVKKPGLSRMTRILSGTPNQPALIGILACLSQNHFAGPLLRAAPNTATILTKELFDYNNILMTAYGTVDAMMKQQCGSNLNNSIMTTDLAKRQVSLKGFMK